MNSVSASAVPTVVSVIGPERDEVAAVAAALQERVPGRRFVIGAGPDTAGGVIAVTAGKDSKDSKDTAIVRAVRDAMGGCVVYSGGDPASLTPLSTEPGVTVVPWDGDAADRRNIDRLAEVVMDRWIDVPRWVSDARRADADRIDRVRVAVRLTAERHASDLLETGMPVSGDAATSDGRGRLDALFRARLRCTVLEHGVEWPHLPESPAPTGVSPVSGGDRQRELLVLVASCGAGLAAAVAVGRLAGPLVGVLVGVVIAVALALVRRRMLAGARRERDRAAGVAQLRRQWGAVATEVVSRLRVPTVADAVVAETTGTGGAER